MSPISFIFDSIFCACVSVSVCVCVCVCRCVCVCVSAFLSLIWGDFLIGRAVEGAEGRRVGGAVVAGGRNRWRWRRPIAGFQGAD